MKTMRVNNQIVLVGRRSVVLKPVIYDGEAGFAITIGNELGEIVTGRNAARFAWILASQHARES